MKKYFRVLLVLLALLLLFSLAYSTAESAHHDCEGEDCPICAMLFLLSSLLGAGVLLFSVAINYLKKSKASVRPARKAFFAVTPVSLKTKLSD